MRREWGQKVEIFIFLFLLLEFSNLKNVLSVFHNINRIFLGGKFMAYYFFFLVAPYVKRGITY